jgi:hypothetical protein
MTSVSEAVEKVGGLGGALAAASAIAYACGFLVVRARASALGTDPGFVLVNQAYAFAGFRFAWTTLFALLVTSPLLPLMILVGRKVRRLAPCVCSVIEWSTLVCLGAVTLAGYVATLVIVHDVLLTPPGAVSRGAGKLLAKAALGDGNLGALMVFGATIVAACSLLWLHTRIRSSLVDNFTVALIVLKSDEFSRFFSRPWRGAYGQRSIAQ